MLGRACLVGVHEDGCCKREFKDQAIMRIRRKVRPQLATKATHLTHDTATDLGGAYSRYEVIP